MIRPLVSKVLAKPKNLLGRVLKRRSIARPLVTILAAIAAVAALKIAGVL